MSEAAVNLTRRQFGQAAGALVLAFTLAAHLAGAQAPKLPGSLANNRTLDAWLRINADGSVMIFTGKFELAPGNLDDTRADRRRRARSAARPGQDGLWRHGANPG